MSLIRERTRFYGDFDREFAVRLSSFVMHYTVHTRRRPHLLTTIHLLRKWNSSPSHVHTPSFDHWGVSLIDSDYAHRHFVCFLHTLVKTLL